MTLVTGLRPAAFFCLTLILAACGGETEPVSEQSSEQSAEQTTAEAPEAASPPPTEEKQEVMPPEGAQGGVRPETFELDNGMQVVVIPDRRVGVVTHMVWYKIGGADEPEGKSGIAHFLEHLMFKGTEKIPPGEFSKIVARNGGRDNAFTSFDYTGYFQRVAVDRLPLVMEMEADRMTNLQLTDEVVLPERDVIIEERRSRVDNNPASLLSEKMNAALFGDHPYGIPLIGYLEEMRQLSRADAEIYYDEQYAPNNAILVVAGDISAEELRPLAEKYYGSIAQREVKGRERPAIQMPVEAARVKHEDARANQPRMSRLYLVPSYMTAEAGQAEALDVLSQILGGGSTSRLYQSLVADQKVAASAGAWYRGTSLDETVFGVYGVPNQGGELETVEAAIDAEIARIIKDGVSEEELSRAKKTMVADAVYAQDSQQSQARLYGSVLSIGGSIEQILEWPERIKSVTAQQVVDAAKAFLLVERSVTGQLIPVASSQTE